MRRVFEGDTLNKKTVKVRLAEKWAAKFAPKAPSIQPEFAQAYLAGFERAKALCVDFTMRYVDRRVDPAFTPEEEKEWLGHFQPGKKQPSDHMKTIGEGT